MATGGRMPTSRERENNRRRERRRRAIAAKIYAGLRMYGNYKLPKHCDNNEVLKALCSEAGWTVEADGTIYRKGCKRQFVGGESVTASPCSSYQSPCISYNPSPASSSFHSPALSPYSANLNSDTKSLIPWLNNFSSASSSASSSKLPQFFHMQGGSMSAPVTPPLSSPTAQSPRIKTDREDTTSYVQTWGRQPYSSLHLSTPPSPARKIVPDSGWFASLQLSSGGPSSPTFSLTSPNPFGIKNGAMSTGSSRMWTPGQSGTCSPIPSQCPSDVQMMTGNVNEFAFGSNSTAGLVKAWEGEKIHDECGSDELELTLGNLHTKKFKFTSC